MKTNLTVNEDPQRKVACNNCPWTGTVADVKPVEDLEQRIAPGEVVPAGECPQCGALASLVNVDTDNQLKVLADDVISMAAKLTAGDIRKALEGLPDDALVCCGIVSDNEEWSVDIVGVENAPFAGKPAFWIHADIVTIDDENEE